MKLKYIALLFLSLLSPRQLKAEGPRPTIIDQSAVHLNHQHKQSRDATVKVVASAGHGSGTYVKIGRSFGIVTAAHVVGQGEHFVIESGSRQTIGTLIWKDEAADLAFLLVERIPTLNPVRMKSGENISAGDGVVYSGFPSSHEMLTFSCNIANPNSENRILVQGFAWFGASGSGFINRRGDLVAVLSAISVESFYGHPQVLETLVIGSILTGGHIAQIRQSIQELD